ncbi:MAG: twin-arginine translocase TatA/TatE family subunit [Crocinitomicaceae bacterium]|nr:twin-arginine translocase TatA/TatE family subunit [Crocinitomicaceae bacterium]MBQ81809.1 twin-arginine translocase TatA/TatE family subunit [Crocinitomicaceae bacterium]|tara:strand:- start:274 stop:471 length:198 start_codon:yes stop_codon:yes gene_type:complete
MLFSFNHLALLQNFGAGGLILTALVVVLLFGGRKIPELMRGLGQGMKEFKDATKGEDSSSDKESK